MEIELDALKIEHNQLKQEHHKQQQEYEKRDKIWLPNRMFHCFFLLSTVYYAGNRNSNLPLSIYRP